MTEAEIYIDYLDPDGFKRTHSVRSEVGSAGFIGEVQEAVEIITKDGFFLVMEETRYVFIPPGQVLRITFSLMETEEGS